MANGQWLKANLFIEIDVKQLLCCDERTQLGAQNPLLDIGDALLDFGVEVEVALQCLVDTLVHPILILLVAVVLEVTVRLGVLQVLLDALPNLLQADTFER